MIHPESRDSAEALAAYLKAHPHRDPQARNDDYAAIEWMDGYLAGKAAR